MRHNLGEQLGFLCPRSYIRASVWNARLWSVLPLRLRRHRQPTDFMARIMNGTENGKTKCTATQAISGFF